MARGILAGCGNTMQAEVSLIQWWPKDPGRLRLWRLLSRLGQNSQGTLKGGVQPHLIILKVDTVLNWPSIRNFYVNCP